MQTLASSVLVLLLCACESGVSRSVKVTIPTGVAQSFTAAAPGILVSDVNGEGAAYFVLCAQAVKNPVSLVADLGFGCLGSRDGTSEAVQAWIQPMPSNWSAADLCAKQVDRSFYKATTLAPADAGTGGALADVPAPTWPQGTGSASWHRDLSPCGGALNAELTLAVP